MDVGSPDDEVHFEPQEQCELDQEGDQVRDQDGNRHGHAREINLAEQVGILHEGNRGFIQAVGKITPHHRARHVEQELRQPVGGQAGDAAEHHSKDHRGQDGLDQVPQRSKDGLLVDGDEIAAHEQHHQVAVAP